MRRSIFRITPLVLFVLGSSWVQWSIALPIYTLTDLGDLPGGAPDSIGWSINSRGQVAGAGFVTDSTNHPFLWQPNAPNSPNGSQIDIPTLPDAWGYSINNFGQIAGPARGGGFISFLWTPNTANGTTGHIIDLGDLPGRTKGSFAFAVNGYGQVVGRSLDSTELRAFLWKPTTPNGETGSMVDLGDLPGGRNSSSAHAINSSGQVTGYSDTATGSHAMLWTPSTPNGTTGQMIDLGDLPGGTVTALGQAINDSGAVAGYSYAAGGERAFLWRPTTSNGASGSMIDLGTLSGHDQSIAWGINSAGWVVGDSAVYPNPYSSRAFLWTEADGMVDVNTLLDTNYPGWTLGFARGINDFGQITGDAIYDPDGPGGIDGYPRGFLITPTEPIQYPAIPEPTSIAIVGGSLASYAVTATPVPELYRRRRERNPCASEPILAALTTISPITPISG